MHGDTKASAAEEAFKDWLLRLRPQRRLSQRADSDYSNAIEV